MILLHITTSSIKNSKDNIYKTTECLAPNHHYKYDENNQHCLYLQQYHLHHWLVCNQLSAVFFITIVFQVNLLKYNLCVVNFNLFKCSVQWILSNAYSHIFTNTVKIENSFIDVEPFVVNFLPWTPARNIHWCFLSVVSFCFVFFAIKLYKWNQRICSLLSLTSFS